VLTYIFPTDGAPKEDAEPAVRKLPDSPFGLGRERRPEPGRYPGFGGGDGVEKPRAGGARGTEVQCEEVLRPVAILERGGGGDADPAGRSVRVVAKRRERRERDFALPRVDKEGVGPGEGLRIREGGGAL